VIQAAAQGFVNREIAVLLDYSPRTVEGLVAEARAWLRARNRPHLVALAITAGLVPPCPCDGIERLSPRQRELAEAVTRGETAVEAARALGISARTATAHVLLARRVTGSPNSTALAARVASDRVLSGQAALPDDAGRGYRILLALLSNERVEEAILRLRLALGDGAASSH
jgi:DNA-binding CsgD family transcriptional regulator